MKSKSYFFCSGLSVKAVGSMEELCAQIIVMFVTICKHLKSLQQKRNEKDFTAKEQDFWYGVLCFVVAHASASVRVLSEGTSSASKIQKQLRQFQSSPFLRVQTS